MWHLFFILWSSTAFSLSPSLTGKATEGEILDWVIQKYPDVDPYFIMSVIKVESNFKTSAVSVDKGRRHLGLMQICTATARSVGFRGTEAELWSWKTNIHYGTKYLKYQLFRYNYNMQDAIAAYNAGTAFRKKDEYINQKYVDSVMITYNMYQRRKKKMRFTLTEVWRPYYKRWL